MSDIAIREVAPDVWTFSRPFARFGVFHFGGRSTAIRLTDGKVWVLASTPLTTACKKQLDSLGPVHFIIGVDALHHMYLKDYANAYPDAKLFAPEPILSRIDDKNVPFSGMWGRDPAGTRYEFEDEIQCCYFSAFKNKDVAFFHIASRSLIVGDLLFNLPCTEQYSQSRFQGVNFVSLDPSCELHAQIMYNLGEDKEIMRQHVQNVKAWDFDKIIPCHGDVIGNDAKKAWDDSYRLYFQDEVETSPASASLASAFEGETAYHGDK